MTELKKFEVKKLEDLDEDLKKQFITALRNDDFIYLAGKPPTKAEIDKLEKELRLPKNDR